MCVRVIGVSLCQSVLLFLTPCWQSGRACLRLESARRARAKDRAREENCEGGGAEAGGLGTVPVQECGHRAL